MKGNLRSESETKTKGVKRSSIQVALTMCLAICATGVQARADCQRVVGTMTETIIPAPNDPNGRALGIVSGDLSGVSTALVTSPDGSTSSDVIVTRRGDMLTGTGALTLAPISDSSTEFTLSVTLTITGGSGKYSDATGTLRYQGVAQLTSPTTGTFNVMYRGSICGPKLKAN